jgi:hypothetical protein
MKSRGHRQRAKRSRWAHCNTPEALRRRRAKMDARRETIAATLPPVDPGPQPLQPWQTVLVLDARGEVMHRIALYVPTDGHRCDQHAAEVDGVRELLTATEVGRRVAGMIRKRPSIALRADLRRSEWVAAVKATC